MIVYVSDGNNYHLEFGDESLESLCADIEYNAQVNDNYVLRVECSHDEKMRVKHSIEYRAQSITDVQMDGGVFAEVGGIPFVLAKDPAEQVIRFAEMPTHSRQIELLAMEDCTVRAHLMAFRAGRHETYQEALEAIVLAQASTVTYLRAHLVACLKKTPLEPLSTAKSDQ